MPDYNYTIFEIHCIETNRDFERCEPKLSANWFSRNNTLPISQNQPSFKTSMNYKTPEKHLTIAIDLFRKANA